MTGVLRGENTETDAQREERTLCRDTGKRPHDSRGGDWRDAATGQGLQGTAGDLQQQESCEEGFLR